MAGTLAERQETGLVDAINLFSEKKGGKPFTLQAGSTRLTNVLSANKVMGRSASGDEPYTDVEIKTTNKIYKLSMKGPSAPSMAGGGLNGLEKIVPGFSGRFIQAAYEKYLQLGYTQGQQIPDICMVEIGAELKRLLFSEHKQWEVQSLICILDLWMSTLHLVVIL